MKSLKESLFTKGPDKYIIKFGAMYELSNVAYHNMISNDFSKVIKMFDTKKLRNSKFEYKVPENNGFVTYWKKRFPDIEQFINMILNIPLTSVRTDEIYVPFSDYYYKDGRHAGDIRIFVDEFADGHINIVIYDSIRHSRPNSIKLRFDKK